jgi:lysophospholipase L1-like esterase
MNDLCLLAASLVAQGHVPGWQLAPILKLPEHLPRVLTAGLTHWCEANTSTPSAKDIGHKALVSLAEVDRPEFSHQSQPTLLSTISVSTVASAPTPAAPAASAPAARSESAPLKSLGMPIRPVTGGQLYQQRLAALTFGKTYTRLAADSFQEQWLNASEQPTYSQWISLLQQEASAMAQGQGTARLTVLLGDSLSLWFPPELMTSDRFWLNQGISGDTTAGILQRMHVLKDTRPDTIYVMAGINDLRRGATDAEVLANLRLIMQQLKQAHPQATVIVHSILPTRLAALPTDRIRRLNYNIATAAQEEGVSFLNLQPSFMDEAGILRRDLTTDGLHLNDRGYRAWGKVIASIF